MDQTFMKEKKILPLVLSMSLPMVLSMLVNSLYNIIDSFFVAKISENAMTALSLVYPLQILINDVAVGLGIGLNSAASFYLGAQEHEKANDSASVGMILSVIHGLILTLVCILIVPHFLRLFTQDEAVISYALTYSYIVFGFTTPITVGIAFEKVFQAEGQMMITMTTMLCGCITNIILDPIFIFGIGPVPKMGIAGAAWATGIGQIVPMVLYFIIYLKKPLPLRLYIRKGMFDPRLCRQIYGVGIPAALNMALPSLMITALNGILASFSSVYVLVLGIYYKLQTFIYLTANGIVQGIRPITGYNYGAGEYKRVRSVFKTALALTAGLRFMPYGIVYFQSGNHLCRMYCLADHQPWIYRFLFFCYRKRPSGRSGTGNSITDYFFYEISSDHCSYGFPVKPPDWCYRRLARLLDCRIRIRFHSRGYL